MGGLGAVERSKEAVFSTTMRVSECYTRKCESGLV